MSFLIRRLLQSFIVLFFTSYIVFMLIALMPGNEITKLKMENPNLKKEDIEILIKQRGLDKPNYIRYFYWLSGLAYGELGYSTTYNIDTQEIIKPRIITTLMITFPAFILSIITALPLGLIAALKNNSMLDYSISAFTFIALSVPTFLLGLIAIYFFALKLKWLPPGGFGAASTYDPSLWNSLKHFIMPVLILSYYDIGRWTRYVRGSFIEVLKEDYIKVAKAKGITSHKVIFKHALKNISLPFISLISLSIPALFSGIVVTETIFGIHGMGLLLYKSIIDKDSNVVMAAFLFITLLTLIFNALADFLYTIADPRINKSKPS